MKDFHENGSSMVEMLGVLGIVACITVGMYAGISSFQAKMRITRLHNQTREIIKSVQDHFSAFSSSSLTADKFYADKMYTYGIFDNVTGTGSGSSSVNLSGHTMKITLPSSTFSSEDKTFQLTYSGVDRKTCAEILAADWGDPSKGLAQIVVKQNSTNYYFRWPRDGGASTVDGETLYLPTELTATSKLCNKVATSQISWDYYF